MLFFPNEII